MCLHWRAVKVPSRLHADAVQVIKGWTEAMQKMKEGDHWELYIPSGEMSYEYCASPLDRLSKLDCSGTERARLLRNRKGASITPICRKKALDEIFSQPSFSALIPCGLWSN